MYAVLSSAAASASIAAPRKLLDFSASSFAMIQRLPINRYSAGTAGADGFGNAEIL